MPGLVTRASSIVAVLLVSCSQAPTRADRDACAAVGGGHLETPFVRVSTGAEVDAGEVVSRGSVPRCGHDAASTRLFLHLHRQRDRLPAGLQALRFSVHVDPDLPGGPALRAIETLQGSGDILVSAEHAASLTSSVLLHEIAHVAMRGRRPGAVLAYRFQRAMEEGVADYAAAAWSGSPVVGAREERRDLRGAPRRRWEGLAVPAAGADEHALGHALAHELWSRAPRSGRRAADFVGCIANAELGSARSIADVVQSTLAGCPESAKRLFAQALTAWLPPELASS